MAGNDHIVINPRERPMSADINDLQAMGARALADLERYRTNNYRTYAAGAVQPVEGVFPFGIFVGGITPFPNGNVVATAPGVFAQDNSALAPTPGVLDSSWRLAYQRVSVDTATPSPGSNTWYLLECRMTEVVTVTESRDILDAITGNFVPTTVTKQVERQLEYQYVTGTATNMPAPTGTDGWQPVCGVFRLAGGGPVAATDIIDLRNFLRATENNLFFEGTQKFGHVVSRTYQTELGTTKYFNRFDVEAVMSGNQQAWFHLPPDLPFRWVALSATTADPSALPSALANGQWFYVYLAAWYGLCPVGQKVRYWNGASESDIQSGVLRGVLVESQVSPFNQGGYTNGSTLHLPPPFNTFVVPVGGAVCIGAFRREGASSVAQQWADGNKVRMAPAASNSGVFYTATQATGGSPQVIPVDPSSPHVFPATAKALRVHATVLHLTAAGGTNTHAVHLTGTASELWADLISAGGDSVWEFDYPLTLPSGSYVPAIDWVYSLGNAGNTFGLILRNVGFEEALI